MVNGNIFVLFKKTEEVSKSVRVFEIILSILVSGNQMFGTNWLSRTVYSGEIH